MNTLRTKLLMTMHTVLCRLYKTKHKNIKITHSTNEIHMYMRIDLHTQIQEKRKPFTIGVEQPLSTRSWPETHLHKIYKDYKIIYVLLLNVNHFTERQYQTRPPCDH